MRRTRVVDDAPPRLKDHKVPVVELICRVCDRHCAHERKLLVKAFGASVTFAEIRLAHGHGLRADADAPR